MTIKHWIAAAGCVVSLSLSAPGFAAGNYCLKQWPGDRDAYSTCLNLQQRNRLEYQLFLRKYGVEPENVAKQAKNGNRAARIGLYCRERWYPNFKAVWRCTQRNAEVARDRGALN